DGAEAAALVRKMIEVEPNSVELHYALARALALTDDLPGLRAALQRVLSLEPEHTGAGLALTRLHLSHGEISQAKERLRTLLAAKPGDPQLVILSGQTAVQERRVGDAVKAFREV